MNEWNFQSRSRSCQSCGQSFADQQPYHTLLFEARSSFERVDVCSPCWEQQHQHGAKDKKGFVSHWQGQFTMPAPPPPEAIQRGNAEHLLRQLTERNDPSHQPAAFILAVMLERKRLLKTREQIRQQGRRTIVYEMPATGEIFTIPDPNLRLDQLEQVQRDVAALLEHGLPSEAPPDAAPVSAGPVEEPFAPTESVPLATESVGPAQTSPP